MIIYEVQCELWDRIHFYKFEGSQLQVGNLVVIKNDYGYDLVKVVNTFVPNEKDEGKYNDVKDIVRLATADDLEKQAEKQSNKDEDFNYCHQLIKKHSLPMKLIDVYYSLDGGRITFAFVSEERVDFRSLVKDLTGNYHKSIRLQQLGARDAVRYTGGVGACGLEQCCRSYLKELPTITMEMAEVQQVAHRGADRISGMCGRLKCCLLYELEVYKYHVKDMPEIGSTIKVKGNSESAYVVSRNVLKKTLRVAYSNTEGVKEIPNTDFEKVLKAPKATNSKQNDKKSNK